MISKKNVLTGEQRINMKSFGIETTDKTTEAEVLTILRKKKFPDFGKTLRAKISCD